MSPRIPTPESTASHARTDEERHYYAFNARAWRLLAPIYDVLVFPLKRLRREVARLAGVGPGDRVLDVATGTGAQAIAFADTGAHVTGIDLSPAMLRFARRNAGERSVEFEVADAREIPFDDARFDVACVSFGLHEMPTSVRLDALREMARVTKPGGKVVIVDYALPAHRFPAWLVFHLVKLYERDNYAEFVRADLRAFLADAGLVPTMDTTVMFGAMRLWSPARIVVASKS